MTTDPLLAYTTGQGDGVGHTQAVVVSIFFLTMLAVVLFIVWDRYHYLQQCYRMHGSGDHSRCRRSWCPYGDAE